MAMIGTASSGPNASISAGISKIDAPKPTMPLSVPAPSPSARTASQIIYAPLVSLRRNGFDLDFDSRAGKLVDDQKRGRRVMLAHDARAYAEIAVQDGLVGDVDSEFYNVIECHVGRSKN